MVYIYRKTIGKKDYYYLRASINKNGKKVTKDVAYLGNNSSKLASKIESLPSKYSKEIRKSYKTIKKFIEINHYLEKIKEYKLKKNPFFTKKELENIEACSYHWNHVFGKLHTLTKWEILKNFVIEFAFHTTSIEGNTITLKEAQSLLTEQLTPKNKTLREVFDLQNTEIVFKNLFTRKNSRITHNLICEVHDKLLKNIDNRKGYRTADVKVFKSRFEATPFKYIKTDIDILLDWYRKNQALHPIVLATLFHHKIEKIHPFFDGNGRTGRMLMNFILVKKGYPPIIIKNENRSKYLSLLNKADKSDLNSSDTVHYKDLVSFVISEHESSYWNIFL